MIINLDAVRWNHSTRKVRTKVKTQRNQEWNIYTYFMAKKAAAHRLSDVSQDEWCQNWLVQGLWRARSHALSVHSTTWCPSCVSSLQERPRSSERMLCFVRRHACTRLSCLQVASTPPKTQTLKQSVAEPLCFHGKQSCFSPLFPWRAVLF